MKKALILGGTGVMGEYLTRYLYDMGFKLDVFSLDDRESKQNLTYIKANAKDKATVAEYLKNDYDAVIDFMMYNTKEFTDTYKMFLVIPSSTSIFLLIEFMPMITPFAKLHLVFWMFLPINII